MSLHHVNIVHESKSNSSDEALIGFVARYNTPSMVQSGFQQPIILARGEDKYGNFEHIQARPESSVPSATLVKHFNAAHEHPTGISKASGAFEEAEK